MNSLDVLLVNITVNLKISQTDEKGSIVFFGQ